MAFDHTPTYDKLHFEINAWRTASARIASASLIDASNFRNPDLF